MWKITNPTAEQARAVGLEALVNSCTEQGQIVKEIGGGEPDTVEAWRIVERTDDGRYKTLFHGIQGSRVLEIGRWYTADIRLVRDGGNQEFYHSGFNVLMSKEDMLLYTARFTAPRRLFLARCEVRNLRPKPTNPKVFLAEHLRIIEIDEEVAK